MTTLNRSSPTYVPSTSAAYSIPVQVGSVRNLCPSVTPGDQAVLSWVDRTANELRCAVLPEWPSMFLDDVVEVADVRTVFSGGGRTIHTGCLAVIGSELLAFVSHYADPNGLVECYVANDVENPTAWSLRGTLRNHTASGPGTKDVRQGGPPTVLPSGRWLLPFHGWLTFGGSALEDGEGLYSSDDQGASWDIEVSFRKGALFSGTAGPQSTTVGFQPSTGHYVMGSHVGPVDQWHLWRSTDGSLSWGSLEQDDPLLTRNPHFYMDDGVNLYAAQRVGATVRIYRVVDIVDETSWVDTGEVGIIAAVGANEGDGFQIVPLELNGFLTPVFTAKDRIARAPRGGWQHGSVALG